MSTNKKVRVGAHGYDILGNIAIIDVDNKKEEKQFAEQLLQRHKSVGTIVAKAGAVKGKYRTRRFRHVAGKKTFITNYKENGCTFVFDIRKAFFSNRLSFERTRIVSQVKSKEKVIVFFSGVGPFTIEIAKAHKDAAVVGIELNSYASKCAKENARLNKTANVKCECGDVRKISKKYKNFADRVIMPAPTNSTEFLDQALLVAKKSATVHIYIFAPSESLYSNATSQIKAHAKSRGYKVGFKFRRIVRSYSPKDAEIVVDYSISKRTK